MINFQFPIQLKDSEVVVNFRRSKRAKRLKLQMSHEGEFMVVAPWLMPKKMVQSFIIQHSGWMETQRVKIEKLKIKRPSFTYKTGDFFYYFGEKVELIVKPCTKKRPTIKIRDDKMIISLYAGVSHLEGIAQVKKTIEDFYRQKADEVIRDRLEFFNEYYGYRYYRVTMRNQKTRWGSCSSKKNLNFNWKLIMAPIEVIDYVVVHELCHLKEMNHSYRFWDLVAHKIPDHKEYRQWLKENHYLLST